MSNLKIDVHLNLAGAGTQNSGCWLSANFKSRYTFQLLKVLYGISNRQIDSTIDNDWADMIEHLVTISQVDYGVVLGFDWIYDRSSREIDRSKTQMMVPDSWVFHVCSTRKGLLPGPGVHPHRIDAIEALNDVIRRGAVLIKWLPPAQNIDVASPDLEEFYEVVAKAGLPLLIHTGGERTFKSFDKTLGDVRKLRYPLTKGVKIIAAHTATKITASSDPDQIQELIQLLEEFPNLWVDNSGICNPGRFLNLPKIAANPLIRSRTLYGSDWPIPSNAFYYLNHLSIRKIVNTEKIKNLIDRDIEIKRSFGYEEESLTRASKVLINLDRWT
jgi:predicted TIM-barrel fold metal-dependent hydrolase